MSQATLNKGEKAMASPGFAHKITPGTDTAVEPRSVPLFLSAARTISMIGFVAIPVLAVRLELTTGLLITGFVFGIASIIFWFLPLKFDR